MVRLERKLERISLQRRLRGRWLVSMVGAALTWMPLEFTCNTGLEIIKELQNHLVSICSEANSGVLSRGYQNKYCNRQQWHKCLPRTYQVVIISVLD